MSAFHVLMRVFWILGAGTLIAILRVNMAGRIRKEAEFSMVDCTSQLRPFEEMELKSAKVCCGDFMPILFFR